MTAAPVAQELRADPARGALGAPRPAGARSDWVPDPLGGETRPRAAGKVYGWLNWTTSGYFRKCPLDTVLLRLDRGYQEVPPGSWLARKDHKGFIRVKIRAD